MKKKYTLFFTRTIFVLLLMLTFVRGWGQDYYRSKGSGDWSAIGSWESSSDNSNWIPATEVPSYEDNTITIRNGHNITLTSSVSIDQLIISDGGRLTIDSFVGYLQINDGEEDADVDIQKGGILQVINNSPSKINKPYSAVIFFDEGSGEGIPKMNVAGRIIVGDGLSDIHTTFAEFGYANADQIIWNNGAILEWNTPGAVPTASGKTFFPEVASSVIPIFRISKISGANVVGGSPIIINGLVELNGTTVNWSGNGTKIFRNGIIATGAGSMVRNAGTGAWQIGDASAPNSAEIGGATGILTLNNPSGINITSASNAILTSNTTLTGGTFTNNGTLNLGAYALSGTSAFTLAAGSNLITSNAGGLVSAIAVTGTKTFTAGTNYTFNASTTTPFPTGTFGNPASLTFNNANVTSNRTTNLTVSGNVNINDTSTFKLNSTSNNLNLGGTMTVDTNATFDNNGENQIINNGSGAIVINGKFITRDKDGFLGNSAAISGITPTLGTASTVEYGLSGNQVVSSGLDYNNITISGSGTKSFSDGNLTVNKLTTVNSGSALSIKTTGDNVASNVLYAKKGLKNLGGTVTFENNAQLIQDTDADNSGNIILLRNASVPSDMYNFWASPVKDQDLKDLYPTTQAKVMILNTATNAYTTITGNALSEIGKGYSIKGSSNNAPHTTANGNFAVTATFTGEPNNSDKSIALSTQNKRFNLIGNPYPSNLSLDVLYQDNANVLDLGTAISPSTVEPTMYFWDNLHHDSITQIQNYSGVNYAVYNAVSQTGVSATNGDQGKKPNGWVKPGQGFIVKSKENNNVNLTLNFVQGRTDGKKLRDAGVINTPYFKNTGNNVTSANRFWLKLTTPNNIYNTVAIVYDDRAKDTYDMFDSTLMTTAANDIFYSLSSDNTKLAIQGRKTFTDSDKVPLGFKNYVAGMHSIAVAEKEGVFAQDQSIYIYDRVLGTTVDISNTPYSYSSVSGSDESRFEIVYKPGSFLGTSDYSSKGFVVYRDSDNFVVSSSKDLNLIELYDMTGKLVYSAKGKSNKHIIPAATLVSGVYVVKVLTSGEVYTKKIIK